MSQKKEPVRVVPHKERSWSRLQREMHETALSKGWWDTERPPLETLMLIVTEVAEARMEFSQWLDGSVLFDSAGLAEELADIAIRIGDAAGQWKIDATPWVEFPKPSAGYTFTGLSPDQLLMPIVVSLARAAEEFRRPEGHRPLELAAHMRTALAEVFLAAAAMHVDIKKAILAKMAKNKKRPHRHGGKRY